MGITQAEQLKVSQDHLISTMRQEFLRRCRQNPRYSLRAYARQLQVDYSTLSKILRGQRLLGQRAILRLGRKVGTEVVLRQPAGDYSPIQEDVFQVIADWYHMAILELLRTRDFTSDEGWLAQRLGLSIREAVEAVERLKRLGLIAEINGKWVDLSGGKTTNITDPNRTSDAQREFQRQVLEKALRALNDVPVAERDQTGITVAVHPDRLPEAKLRIRKFRRELARFLARGDSPKEVYQVSISLFPLTSPLKKGKPSR